MRKIFAAVFLFFISVSLNAAHAYNWYAGASFGFGYSDTDRDNSSHGYFISPEIGYIINDKFDAGLGFLIANSQVKENGSSEKTNELGITPFVRYAAFRSGKFTVFARAQVSYSSADYDTADDRTVFSAGAAPVVEFAVSDRITLFTSFMLLEFSKTDSGGNSTADFGFNADMNDLTLGFSVNF
jgi:hypothetical protein